MSLQLYKRSRAQRGNFLEKIRVTLWVVSTENSGRNKGFSVLNAFLKTLILDTVCKYSFLANRSPEGIQVPGYHLAKNIKNPIGNTNPGVPFVQNY